MFQVGSARADAGSIARGAIETGRGPDGRTREIPVLVCHGAQDGPSLWINGATHGDEPEGAFSIFQLFAQLDPAQVTGTVVGVPAMNVPAFEAGKRGDPLDTFSYDMNRLYPGRADGYPTERAAWAHWVAMRDAKIIPTESPTHSRRFPMKSMLVPGLTNSNDTCASAKSIAFG